MFQLASEIVKASCPVDFDLDRNFSIIKSSQLAKPFKEFTAKQCTTTTLPISSLPIQYRAESVVLAASIKNKGARKRAKKMCSNNESMGEGYHEYFSSSNSVFSFSNTEMCSRIFPYDPKKRVRFYSRQSFNSIGENGEFFSSKSAGTSPKTITRNLRHQTGARPDCTSAADGRSARANLRRMLKDKVFTTELLAFDTLAGREPRLRFGRSKIHSWGIFSEERINKGEMIIEYRGELIGNAVSNAREIEYEEAKIGSDYMFRMDSTTVCDATKQGNMARFMNASCNPNCFTKIINVKDTKRIVIYAKKDIDSGEELCYDYKFPLESDDKKRIPCHCGARNCKGYMNWVS